jgi:hypothetical protein
VSEHHHIRLSRANATRFFQQADVRASVRYRYER